MDEIIYFLENYHDILPKMRERLDVTMRYVSRRAGLCSTSVLYIERDKTQNTQANTLLYLLMTYQMIAKEKGIDISDLLKPHSQKVQPI